MGTRVTVQGERRCWESQDSIILSPSVFYFWGLSMTVCVCVCVLFQGRGLGPFESDGNDSACLQNNTYLSLLTLRTHTHTQFRNTFALLEIQVKNPLAICP